MLNVDPVLNVRVLPKFPRSVIVQWSVAEDLMYPVAFDIYRSGNSKDGLEKLNTLPIVNYSYEDIGLKPQSKLFDVTYFLDIIFPFTDKKQRVGPIPLAPHPRLARTFFVARRMDEKNGIEYSSHTGVDLTIFKQRHWGETCTSCYNPVLEAPSSKNCGSCLGIGIVGGYWNPVKTLGKLEPLVKSRNLLDKLNYSENISTQASLRAFPLVQDGDIILENSRGVMWFVNTVQTVEHGRFPVKQIVELREVERSDPLYSKLRY